MHTRSISLVAVSAVFCFSTLSDLSAQDQHWTATVCRNVTGVPTLTIQGGPGRNDNDVFASWDRNNPTDVFPFPARSQGLNRVYVQVNTPVDGNARVCIKRDGVPKKNIDMTKAGNEHHDVDAGDSENSCGC